MDTALETILEGKYVKTNCPNPDHEDSDPSYVIYPTGGYCFGCGFRESPEVVMARTGGRFDTRQTRRKRTSSDPVTNLDGHVSFWHRTLTVGPRKDRVHWLYERGIGPRAVETYKIGHSGDHFTIPVWTYGVVTGYKKRSDPKYADPDSPKYLNQKGSGLLFTTYAAIRPETLVITEGEFDAIMVSQYGYDCATSTTGADGLVETIQSLRSIQSVQTVYVSSDLDDAGDKCYEGIKQIRPDARRLVWSQGNDISEFLCGIDSGSRGEALRSLIREADMNAR